MGSPHAAGRWQPAGRAPADLDRPPWWRHKEGHQGAAVGPASIHGPHQPHRRVVPRQGEERRMGASGRHAGTLAPQHGREGVPQSVAQELQERRRAHRAGPRTAHRRLPEASHGAVHRTGTGGHRPGERLVALLRDQGQTQRDRHVEWPECGLGGHGRGEGGMMRAGFRPNYIPNFVRMGTVPLLPPCDVPSTGMPSPEWRVLADGHFPSVP